LLTNWRGRPSPAGVRSLYLIKIQGAGILLNNVVENIELRTANIANGIFIAFARHFTLDNLNILGTVLNSYSAIVMEAFAGNVAWGKIDNIHVDKMGSVIVTYGTDASHVVTDLTINNIFAENITGKALRFINWTDTIDVPYFYVELAADNAIGMICNDGANPNAENGVYDINVNRLIVDEWAYTGTVCIKLNNCKEIFVHGVYNGDPRDVLTTLVASAYCQSYVVTEQSEVYPFTYTHNSGFASGRISVSHGDWIQHGVGRVPTSIVVTPEYNYFVWIANSNSSHFQIGMCYANNVTVSNAVINWAAYYQPTL
jgi:hypothetical protein